MKLIFPLHLYIFEIVYCGLTLCILYYGEQSIKDHIKMMIIVWMDWHPVQLQ